MKRGPAEDAGPQCRRACVLGTGPALAMNLNIVGPGGHTIALVIVLFCLEAAVGSRIEALLPGLTKFNDTGIYYLERESENIEVTKRITLDITFQNGALK